MTAGAIAVPTVMPLRPPIPGQHKTCIDTNTKVELHSATHGVTIYYTVNGSKPEPFQTHGQAAKSTFRYREPFRLPGGKRVVKAMAVGEDGLRESHICTKEFNVEQLPIDNRRNEDDDVGFIRDIPLQEAARKEVNKFSGNMVSSKDAWAEVQKIRETEDMMKEMSMIGSNKRKPTTGPRFLNSRKGDISHRANVGTVNGYGDVGNFTTKRSPPDNSTQAMRLQRQTDFLKCVHCFAPRPADPYARFCNDCGNPVPQIPQTRLPPPEAGQMGTCVHCNSLVPFNTPTCLICEAPIPPQNQPMASIHLADKRVCVECGTGNPINLSRCITCEAVLLDVSKPINVGTSAPPLSKDDGRLMTCTKCGRVNNPDARFCDWCGAKPVAPVSNLICSKCHANNNPYAKHCGSCGVLMEPPQRPEMRNSGFAVNINPQTMGSKSQAQWLPISLPANPIPKCDMATQTVGLFFPSQKDINRKQLEEEEKLAIEKQIRDRKPLTTTISPGRGYWRKQMDHVCAHVKAHAQNNAEFRALIGEPRMGKIVSTAIHEDGYELSLTVNFALRDSNDPFVGKKIINSEYLSDFTKSSRMKSYASEESLLSARSAGRSTSRSTARSTSGKKNKRKVKKTKPRTTTSDGEKLTEEDKELLKEIGKSREGRSSEVQQLIEEGANPSCCNRDGMPALHVAVSNKHLDAIPVLVQEGADVNQKGLRGNTALHEAVVLGHSGLEVLETLLSCGANPQKKNDKGESPYDMAIKAGYETVANSLASNVGQSALDKLIRPRKSPTMMDEI